MDIEPPICPEPKELMHSIVFILASSASFLSIAKVDASNTYNTSYGYISVFIIPPISAVLSSRFY